MRITYLHIKNFKSVEELTITDIESVLILVGRNNAGKSIMINAIRTVCGDYKIAARDFHSSEGNIVIGMKLAISEQDLVDMHKNGVAGNYKHYDLWKKNFCQKFPSYREVKDEGQFESTNTAVSDFGGGTLEFEYVYGRDGVERYRDGFKKNNSYIKSILPKIYFVDHYRSETDIRRDLMMLQQGVGIQELRDDRCIFDTGRHCHQCFDCIGVINKKKPEQLTLMETSRLLQYKMFSLNLDEFTEKLNKSFTKNGAIWAEIHYEVRMNADEIFKVDTVVMDRERGIERNIEAFGEGMRSIYILSLLETYAEMESIAPYLIMIEDPETFLHPQLQKVASEILYRLSRKNQVIFSTHEPEMLFNFTSKQIRQVYLDQAYNTVVKEDTDIDEILNDLGYAASDLMNVSFVFIVEGKQDKSRLPLLLNRYYSEMYDDAGRLKRIAILSTNSCTNIKTYANLKYINTLYLKDQFMMIRDGDGKDPQLLGRQLCKYYGERADEDKGNLPRVTDRNVLILKYYSFENYFLFPEIMEKIGVVESVDAFYNILWGKYTEYLYKLSSTKQMLEKLSISIETKQELIDNMEHIRTYVRGHNLYDIFYGRYKGNESEILERYIELAPREIFGDILDKIDNFVFFHSRKK